MGLLEGTVTLVTGGARGQGEAEARLVVAEGGSVVVTDVLGTEGAKLAADLGDGARFCRLDVADEQAWIDAVTFTLAEFGRIDGLINNAGVSTTTPLVDITVDEFDRVVSINQKGVVLGMKHAARAMIAAERGGAIVNISSETGKRPARGKIVYGGSKAAVAMMTQSAALELAPHRIRVNAILPGIIETAMVSVAPAEAVARKLEGTPLNRLGQPSEIAEAALFLLSSKSAFVTGSCLEVDGGSTLV